MFLQFEFWKEDFQVGRHLTKSPVHPAPLPPKIAGANRATGWVSTLKSVAEDEMLKY